jgi:hypothetical protein
MPCMCAATPYTLDVFRAAARVSQQLACGWRSAAAFFCLVCTRFYASCSFFANECSGASVRTPVRKPKRGCKAFAGIECSSASVEVAIVELWFRV